MKGTNQFLQGISGSMENFTVCQWADGDQVVRSRIRKPKNPRTAAQQANRNRFADCQQRASALKYFLLDNFKKHKPTASSYSAFIKRNMNRSSGMDLSNLAALAEQDYYTWGIAGNSGLAFSSLSVSEPTLSEYSGVIQWVHGEDTSTEKATDQLKILVFELPNYDWKVINTGAVRADQFANVQFTSFGHGTTLVVPYFYAETVGICSTSTPKAVLYEDQTIKLQ